VVSGSGPDHTTDDSPEVPTSHVPRVRSMAARTGAYVRSLAGVGLLLIVTVRAKTTKRIWLVAEQGCFQSRGDLFLWSEFGALLKEKTRRSRLVHPTDSSTRLQAERL
jgi:hypothetical protein